MPTLTRSQIERRNLAWDLAPQTGRLGGIVLKAEERLSVSCANVLRHRALPGVLWWHTANEAKRSGASWEVQKAMGFRAGVPDLIIVLPAGDLADCASGVGLFFVELKKDPGTGLSAAQKAFESDCLAAAVPHAVIRSTKEFTEQAQEWGVLTG